MPPNRVLSQDYEDVEEYGEVEGMDRWDQPQPPQEGGEGDDEFFSDEEPEVVSFGAVSSTKASITFPKNAGRLDTSHERCEPVFWQLVWTCGALMKTFVRGKVSWSLQKHP